MLGLLTRPPCYGRLGPQEGSFCVQKLPTQDEEVFSIGSMVNNGQINRLIFVSPVIYYLVNVTSVAHQWYAINSIWSGWVCLMKCHI